MTEPLERHTFSILLANEPGALARVIGLFSGRGYNIDSLTVAEVDAAEGLSRITLTTTGTRMVIDQIEAQLSRIVPIRLVVDLTEQGPVVERELALVKVAGVAPDRALRLASQFGGRVLDVTETGAILELTDTAARLDAFIDALRPLGLAEIARTGSAALSVAGAPVAAPAVDEGVGTG